MLFEARSICPFWKFGENCRKTGEACDNAERAARQGRREQSGESRPIPKFLKNFIIPFFCLFLFLM